QRRIQHRADGKAAWQSADLVVELLLLCIPRRGRFASASQSVEWSALFRPGINLEPKYYSSQLFSPSPASDFGIYSPPVRGLWVLGRTIWRIQCESAS